MRTWRMWAHRETLRGDVTFRHFGSRRYVELHMMGRIPVVEVDLVEDQEGAYWGWLDAGPDKKPSMIWPSQHQFNMCFAYGYEKAEESGRGRHIRLTVKEVEKPQFIPNGGYDETTRKDQ